MFCTNCGSEIEEGNAFCTNCGMPMDPAGDQPPTSKRKRKLWLIPVVALVLIALTGGLLFGAWKLGMLDDYDLPFIPSSSESITEPNSTTSSSTTPSVDASYYLAPSEGKVAIYSSDSATPLEVTDITVDELSSQSIAELNTHVSATSLEDAKVLVGKYRQEALDRDASAFELKVKGADGTTRTATIHRQGSSERVFADSNTRALTIEEVESLSDAERLIAWNEIVASNNGYVFKNGGLNIYFSSCSWYQRNPSANWPGDISATAKSNIDLLQSHTDEWWLNLALN